MLKRFLCLCLLCLCCVAVPVNAAGITNFSKLVTADYWIENNPEGETIILGDEGVEKFNAEIRKVSPTVVDLANYPTTIKKRSLKMKLNNFEALDEDLYLRGNKVSENYKGILRNLVNAAAITDDVQVKYAVVVRRSNLRNLPTGEGLFYFAADKDFDALQETALDPCDPVAVLHTSQNGQFHYVQAVNYSGWISTYDIAFTDRETWLKYVAPEKFVVVVGKSVKLKTWDETVEYQQGSRIPLSSVDDKAYVLNVAGRGKDGNLDKVKVKVAKNAALNEGYLPYTSNNILRSAFKFYGEPYGWGGLKNSVDCSSLMYNAYRTVGIYLPRNADEQEASAGLHLDLNKMDDAAKLTTIKGLTPGTGLYMDNHCLMYLGKSNGVPFVLHALGSYYNEGKNVRVMRIVVSDLTLNRHNGNTMFTDLTNAVEFK